MDHTKNAVSIFNKYASEYQDKFMDVSLYHDTFDIFCDSIPKTGAEILELACGPGNITKYLLSKRPDFKILGTDLSENMIALAKVNNPEANFQLMDSRNIYLLNHHYDGIMVGFCLPYLSKKDVFKLISDSTRILLPKGIIYISTMEDDYSRSGFRKGSQGDEIYMYFHHADYLTQSLLEHDFKIIHIDRKVTVMSDGTSVTDLVIMASKNS